MHIRLKGPTLVSRIRGITSEGAFGVADGMPQNYVANLETITTIPKDCLRSCVTALSTKKVKEIETAIHFALSME